MKSPENFLPEKYSDLPGSKPVERAVQKMKREGGKAPHGRAERVEAYLDRLEDVIKDKQGFEHLKYQILEKYVTKPKDIPESYWKSREEARRRGESGDWASATPEQLTELKLTHAKAVLNDQRASLEQWVDYFASTDSDYVPNNLKYWIFRNVIGLQELVKKKDGDKEYIEFPKRSRGTVKPFPDINYEALAYVVDSLVKKLSGEHMEFEYDIQPDEREAFKRFLAKEDFAKLYAWSNELMNPIPEHLLSITEGKWVKYDKGSDSNYLVQTIRGRGTGWCTAGHNTAQKQLQGGDFYVYYSLDDNGEAKIPRLAIRMEGTDKIAEDPRGVAYKQNLDPYMGPILEEKLKEFGPVGEVYKKKSGDMKRLTGLSEKQKNSESLTKDDLVFLYEIDQPIEGFGYQKDPRIAELRKDRNTEEDMSVIFECTRDQIANVPSQISETTKVYVGQLEPGIFQKLPATLEHVYTSFPDKPIRRENVELGGKSAEQLISEMNTAGINISDQAKFMLKSHEFVPGQKTEEATLIRLTVADLGFKTSATTDQIFERAQALGLELCPADTGPNYRLKYQNQPLNEWFCIGMKQISGQNGIPRVFHLARNDDGLWLDDYWAKPDHEWIPDYEFVFRLRPSTAKLTTGQASIES